jgi:hypothetical protein
VPAVGFRRCGQNRGGQLLTKKESAPRRRSCIDQLARTPTVFVIVMASLRCDELTIATGAQAIPARM